MPRYSFTLEEGTCIADPDATEDLADNQAAMDYAKLFAKDLARKPCRSGQVPGRGDGLHG
jgi:hypothetical protein